MKKFGLIALAIVLGISFALAVAPDASAQAKKKYEKWAADPRHEEMVKTKFKAETSKKKFTWRLSDTWGGLVNHDVVVHFCDSVYRASGGRLEIKPLPTGSVVGAFELFDAVSKGVLDVGHSWSGYWKGKDEAFTLFASVPLSMDVDDYAIWYWQGEGKKLGDELYGRYGLKLLFVGNAGQELGFFAKKPYRTLDEFKGIKVRTVGWFMDILNRMGINATALPGPEVYLALERGVVDSAEFSSPTITYGMGFHEVCKYVMTPGFHQPSAQMDLFINKKKWEELPQDLKDIVEICAAETDAWCYQYMEYHNVEAVKRLKAAGVEFVQVSDEALNEFAKVSQTYMEELKAKYPSVKKIRESQEKFIKDHAEWKALRSGVSTWPLETYMKKEATDYKWHRQ